ncbi:GPI transamidase component GAA1 [Fulvia fulva]|uniref:GPI transamidase component GAA1 n=1 Tax=Passalora fulva TaxID=5499 RepID=A0A9Q8UUS9_PASFU|nr:GPI transamidase component GAA1 [Fulvia fulva]KAK4611739.1 GPI transamidase component GAA1 [Fulvia fulva]KAK4612379.1 GPI transamidase component GAA1 [Fulvia fulva]UJO23289.1 GPI transamidase component GAA1 [Fulvia fulva]WPV21569.1 GPI transamidase component GAA1 [Fulvia fulva]WPV36613.1 GPI transamidase component GAA1 [Fulvia fulva]
MALSARLLTLRRSPILLKLPPYLSALLILVGFAWLLLLPLNEYSRQTYISENAILPGQVHTYFGGSEHNVFRAYRQEVYNLGQQKDEQHRVDGLYRILGEIGLKNARQTYIYKVAGETISGTNIYGLLQGPRADATEAMVLIAAWRNFDGEVNYSAVALALTLAQYFKRWSIWSKDIIVLFPDDSTYGPEAWVSAYHSTSTTPTSSRNISSLPVKAGALQGAVALDYPVGPWGKRFEKLDVLYDGINGALPNLDLLNTAVSVASSQMNVGCSLHGMHHHSDKYQDRLKCLAKGVMTQAAGHATGPHSAFMAYHVDAITLKTVGDGWHDEMSLGRVTESVFRSINNLLEKFHQSFFFYLLLNTHRFVSIGSYLPAAMLVAGSFSVNALALWVLSGKGPKEFPGEQKPAGGASEKLKAKAVVAIQEGEDVALIPKAELETVERKMFVPATVVLMVHLASCIPLWALTHLNKAVLPSAHGVVSALSYIFAIQISILLVRNFKATAQQLQMMQSFSLLFLGATLSTWATINFSLALVVGLLASPLSFIRPATFFTSKNEKREQQTSSIDVALSVLSTLVWLMASPPLMIYALSQYLKQDLGWVLLEIAKGWTAQGVWSNLVVWNIWWPAWVIAGTVLFSNAARKLGV